MPSRKLFPKPLLDPNELLEFLRFHKFNEKHAKTIWCSVIQKQITDYEQMPELPIRLIPLLKENFVITTSKVLEKVEASDGSTTKLMIELQDGRKIETVLMRYGEVELRNFPNQEKEKKKDPLKFRSNKRVTVCVSSQVGCAMGCTFCATGSMGKIGSLLAGEILEQLYHAQQIEKIRNVVFMGMGEPLDNYKNVKLSVEAMVDQSRFCLSPSRVSVSTVGIIPKIIKMSEDLPFVSLAFSLHAPTQDLRLKIVPTSHSYPVDKIMEACDLYMLRQNEWYHQQPKRIPKKLRVQNDDEEDKENLKPIKMRRRVLLEYVLLGPELNCSAEVAHQLGELISFTPERLQYSFLNVIPYNPTKAGDLHGYQPPSQQTINQFMEIVRSYGVSCSVRQELGQDVNAACGQLVVEGLTKWKPKVKDIEDVIIPSTSKKLQRQVEFMKKNKKQIPEVLSPSFTFFQKALFVIFIIFLARLISKLYLLYIKQ